MTNKFKACSVGGCSGNSHYTANGKRGFCSAHYQRLKRHGAPLAGGTPTGELQKFFEDVVLNYCEAVHGPPPTPKHESSHSCGKGHLGCVAKGHLSWKTCAENCADKLVHGTHDRGERHALAKITEYQAREILSLKGKETLASLSKRYGISTGNISRIHSGKNWSWL